MTASSPHLRRSFGGRRRFITWAAATVATAVCLPLFSARAALADFSFIHVTDTHVTGSDAADSPAAKDTILFKEIAALAPKPAFILSTGDVTESGLAVEFERYRAVKKASLPDDLPCYEAPGNHDSRWNPQGKEGFTKGILRPTLWHSWDRENIHFVVLDSTVLLQHWGHFDQEQLDWLAQDLKKVGTKRPIVLGFHHMFANGKPGDSSQVDNYAALLDVLASYNVKLFLIGHGHSDVQWNIDGVPAVMAKGLYQGSYHLIQVTKDRMRVLRRTEAKPTPEQEIYSIPLAPVKRPRLRADVEVKTGEGTVTVERGELPLAANVQFSLGGKTHTLSYDASSQTFRGTFPTEGLLPGTHRSVVTASVPEGAQYLLTVPVKLSAPDRIAPRWSVSVGSGVQSKVVRGANGLLLVPTMGGTLHALDAATGGTRWRFKTGGSLFSVPLVEDGTVYVGSADHFVYALDAATGALRWKTETGGTILGGPARAKGVVCIASTDMKIYGLDEKTGKTLWTAPIGSLYQSQAVTDGERFFLGGWDQMFRCLDAATGKELWSQKFGRSFYYSPAIGSPRVTNDGRVFVTSNDGLLHAMDTTTGKVLWETPSQRLGYSGPLFKDGRIYNASLSDTGTVFCFDAASGQKIWETPTGSVIYDSSCAEAGGNIYVGCVNGLFSALQASDGKLLWQYRLGPGHLLASPATDDVHVYIGNLDGTVAAFPLNAPAGATAAN